MIQACMFVMGSNAAQAAKLSAFCAKMDGTNILCLSSDEIAKIPYPFGAVAAFYMIAGMQRGRPFMWIEHDCSPLRSGWLAEIAQEYSQLSKTAILTAPRSRCPHDVASGIGVYPPDILDVLPPLHHFAPENYGHAWDKWMEENLQHRLCRTKLMQHSHGIYDENGSASPHRFPRDSWMLNKETALFHADKFQELIS